MFRHRQKYLFKRDNLQLVRRVVRCNPFGLALDVDGTISEIAQTPSDAVVPDDVRKILSMLAARLPLLAVISGRPATEAQALVGVEGIVYVGNHGLERSERGQVTFADDACRFKPIIAQVGSELSKHLAAAGIIIENKAISLAVHYRKADNPEMARNEILSALRAISPSQELTITEGKMVIELRPRINVNKGVAVEALVQERKLKGIIYAGDDLTDLNAFAALHKLRSQQSLATLAIAVAGPETPHKVLDEADLVLDGVSGIRRFLRWLVKEVKSISSDQP